MPLNLPANFEKDIQGRDTNLIPVVVISTYSGSYDGDGTYLNISTNGGTIAGTNTLPLL